MTTRKAVGIAAFILSASALSAFSANPRKPDFSVIAFFTGKKDDAHISFLREAERWFPRMAAKYNFSFDTTSNWNNLNATFLSKYQVVVFLDTRPEDPTQRAAFQTYMEHGGAWMGFHFAGFALTPSDYPANWDWYHNTFLGAGQYVSNTWRPVSAILRVEDRNHPATRHLPETFKSSPSEWYRWAKDLRQNPDIDILVSIDSTSFPLGTGPKLHEIWHSGYYPVVWTNRKFRMIYLNMGHNDIDYEHKYDTTNKTLSYTLNNPIQDQLIVDGLLWLGGSGKREAGSGKREAGSGKREAGSGQAYHRNESELIHFRCFDWSSSNQLSTTISSSATPPATRRIMRKRRSSGATAYCAARSNEKYPPAGKRAVERPSENVGVVRTSTATKLPPPSR